MYLNRECLCLKAHPKYGLWEPMYLIMLCMDPYRVIILLVS